jgi:hypothetical protein
VAYTLPAGSHIVAEIHYQHVSEQVVDRGKLGVFFADRGAADPVTDVILEARGDVPAGAGAGRFHAETTLDRNTTVLALRPDVLPGVASVEVSARKPGGGSEILLFAKDIPIDWPTPYIFKEGVTLPSGTTLAVTAYLRQPRCDAGAGRRPSHRQPISAARSSALDRAEAIERPTSGSTRHPPGFG